ncbi:MAG: hypothetical protein RIS82_561 [Actinomycetota bacterium]
MRHSQFHEYMADEFGAAYAKVVAEDLVISALGDQTANQALAAGRNPKEVWLAVCEASGVPKNRWHGVSKEKPKPH